MSTRERDDRRQRLGQLIRGRRKALHLTQDEVHELGGPAAATLRKIEAGQFGTLRLGTTWPLERVLGWRPGAINGFLSQTDRESIDAAVEPNYDALRVNGQIPRGVDLPDVSADVEDQRPSMNIPAEVTRGMSEEQLRELEARIVAEAWKARRDMLGA